MDLYLMTNGLRWRKRVVEYIRMDTEMQNNSRAFESIVKHYIKMILGDEKWRSYRRSIGEVKDEDITSVDDVVDHCLLFAGSPSIEEIADIDGEAGYLVVGELKGQPVLFHGKEGTFLWSPNSCLPGYLELSCTQEFGVFFQDSGLAKYHQDFKIALKRHINDVVGPDEWKSVRRKAGRVSGTRDISTIDSIVEKFFSENSGAVYCIIQEERNNTWTVIGKIDDKPLYYNKGTGVFIWAYDPDGCCHLTL